MQSAFSNVSNTSLEADTKILQEYETKFGHYNVLYQKWFYDSFIAESLIFLSSDVESLSEDALEEEVRSSPLVKEDTVVAIFRGEDYTFVNFNYEVYEGLIIS